MQYYILMPSDGEADTLNEANLLGEESLGNFWPGSGMAVLMTLVYEQPDALPFIKIVNDKGNQIGIGDFLESLNTLNIKKQ